MAAPPREIVLSENDIQRCVFEHLRKRGAPGIVFWHTPNGGIHQIGRRRGINSGLGVLSGVADVIIVKPPHTTVYALELKKRGGRVTKAQVAFLDAIESAGGFATWVDTLDDALWWLEWHGLLIGKAEGMRVTIRPLPAATGDAP